MMIDPFTKRYKTDLIIQSSMIFKINISVLNSNFGKGIPSGNRKIKIDSFGVYKIRFLPPIIFVYFR
jgi:hypothetical protein